MIRHLVVLADRAAAVVRALHREGRRDVLEREAPDDGVVLERDAARRARLAPVLELVETVLAEDVAVPTLVDGRQRDFSAHGAADRVEDLGARDGRVARGAFSLLRFRGLALGRHREKRRGGETSATARRGGSAGRRARERAFGGGAGLPGGAARARGEKLRGPRAMCCCRTLLRGVHRGVGAAQSSEGGVETWGRDIAGGGREGSTSLQQGFAYSARESSSAERRHEESLFRATDPERRRRRIMWHKLPRARKTRLKRGRRGASASDTAGPC